MSSLHVHKAPSDCKQTRRRFYVAIHSSRTPTSPAMRAWGCSRGRLPGRASKNEENKDMAPAEPASGLPMVAVDERLLQWGALVPLYAPEAQQAWRWPMIRLCSGAAVSTVKMGQPFQPPGNACDLGRTPGKILRNQPTQTYQWPRQFVCPKRPTGGAEISAKPRGILFYYWRFRL